MSVPARFREVFTETFGDERFFVTKCPVDLGNGVMGRGLAVYPYVEWQSLCERVERETGLTAAQLNSIRRLILAPAVECTADKQGRVLVPPTLRAYAELERDVVVVGMQRKLEIWSQGMWQQVVAQAEKDFPADTPALAALGL